MEAKLATCLWHLHIEVQLTYSTATAGLVKAIATLRVGRLIKLSR
ncbi:MAG: hypothetical protein AAFW70_22710 [Cyanobacteria bacterium J06635_10]